MQSDASVSDAPSRNGGRKRHFMLTAGTRAATKRLKFANCFVCMTQCVHSNTAKVMKG
jgi:hypothetical protein